MQKAQDVQLLSIMFTIKLILFILHISNRCISLKHSQIVKENDSRRKEIQTNIKQFEKEFSSQIAGNICNSRFCKCKTILPF